MHRARADLDRVIEGARKRLLLLALAPGLRGKPRFPLAAARRVDAELRQAMTRKLGPHRCPGLLVGIKELDRAKARAAAAPKRASDGCSANNKPRLAARRGMHEVFSRPARLVNGTQVPSPLLPWRLVGKFAG